MKLDVRLAFERLMAVLAEWIVGYHIGDVFEPEGFPFPAITAFRRRSALSFILVIGTSSVRYQIATRLLTAWSLNPSAHQSLRRQRTWIERPDRLVRNFDPIRIRPFVPVCRPERQLAK